MTKLRDFWRWSERVQDRFGVRVVLAVLSLGSLADHSVRLLCAPAASTVTGTPFSKR